VRTKAKAKSAARAEQKGSTELARAYGTKAKAKLLV